VFILADAFQRHYGAQFRKPGLGLLAPCVDFNFAKLCVLTQLDKDSAQSLLGEDRGHLIANKETRGFVFHQQIHQHHIVHPIILSAPCDQPIC
jgi:hypothetical protein